MTPSGRKAAREALEWEEDTEGATDITRALREALDALDERDRLLRAIHDNTDHERSFYSEVAAMLGDAPPFGHTVDTPPLGRVSKFSIDPNTGAVTMTVVSSREEFFRLRHIIPITPDPAWGLDDLDAHAADPTPP